MKILKCTIDWCVEHHDNESFQLDTFVHYESERNIMKVSHLIYSVESSKEYAADIPDIKSPNKNLNVLSLGLDYENSYIDELPAINAIVMSNQGFTYKFKMKVESGIVEIHSINGPKVAVRTYPEDYWVWDDFLTINNVYRFIKKTMKQNLKETNHGSNH